MAPVYLKLFSTNRVVERIQTYVSSFPPPVVFVRSQRASTKQETTDYCEFGMKFDPSDENSKKTKKAVLMYEDRDPEMWCEWREHLDKLYRLVPLIIAKQQATAFVLLVGGKAALTLYLTHQS
jgi:hypothetical protein